MTDAPAAIQGTFATYKLWPSRNLLQLIIEVPAEKQEAVFAALGYPLPGSDIWVGIARLQPSIESNAATRDDDKVVIRAVMLAKDPAFQQWAGADDANAAAQWIRAYCGIKSRRELATDQNARALFERLMIDFDLARSRLPYQVGS